MPSPDAGDILICKNGLNTFVLLDALTRKYVAGPVQGFEHAVAVAHARGVKAVWQQPIDDHGQPCGEVVPALVT